MPANSVRSKSHKEDSLNLNLLKREYSFKSSKWRNAHSTRYQSQEGSHLTQIEVKVLPRRNDWIAFWSNKKNTTDNTKKRWGNCCYSVSRRYTKIADHDFTPKSKTISRKKPVYLKDYSLKTAHYPLKRWRDPYRQSLSMTRKDQLAQLESLTICMKTQTIK